jgi:hypothetical protein
VAQKKFFALKNFLDPQDKNYTGVKLLDNLNKCKCTPFLQQKSLPFGVRRLFEVLADADISCSTDSSPNGLTLRYRILAGFRRLLRN